LFIILNIECLFRHAIHSRVDSQSYKQEAPMVSRES